MDELTREQTIASNLVGIWFGALTEASQASLSEHDLSALETMVCQVLGGDEDLIAVLAAQTAEYQESP